MTEEGHGKQGANAEATARILVVDDSPDILDIAQQWLELEGYTVEPVGSGREAVARSTSGGYDLVITDLAMPEMGGMEVLAHFAEHCPNTMVIILTGFGTIETAVEAIKKGAFDYLTKPFRGDQIIHSVKKALEIKRLKTENLMLQSVVKEYHTLERIIGRSKAMQAVFRILSRVAKTDSTILIMGESGTGKELIANAIHEMSDRSKGPFIPINCGAIPEELLEAEVFGHEKGAFTGAIRERMGRFERAHQGTIFLDEIGEMSLRLQVKLLRFLQERQIVRVGGNRTIAVDVRILAATNKNLEQAVVAGEFREDLYYRLNVIPVTAPPLREREGDVVVLVNHFLRRHCAKYDMPVKTFSREALAALEHYDWPGNVRELENILERLVLLTEEEQIRLGHLPARIRSQAGNEPVIEVELGDQGIDLKQTLSDLEDRLILDALKRTDGVKNKAAELLGLKRTTLIEKMKKKQMVYADEGD